jgi:hypothetical protein
MDRLFSPLWACAADITDSESKAPAIAMMADLRQRVFTAALCSMVNVLVSIGCDRGAIATSAPSCCGGFRG